MLYYLKLGSLRSIYFAIFDSNLNYCSLVWAQNYNVINRLVILQKKALRIMNHQPRNSHISPLFRKSVVLKFTDKINLENILFISESINNLLPSLFNNRFAFSSDTHKYNTSWSSDDKLQKYSYRTNTYGKNLIIISATESWNNSQNNPKTISLTLLTPSKIKLLLSNEYLKNY